MKEIKAFIIVWILCYINHCKLFKKLRFILSVRSDFHIIESLSIAVHAFVSRVSMSFSVDEMLLPNTPQDTNYTATCLPSRKLYKLHEPDTQETAGEARMNSSVRYSYGPPHMAEQKQDDQLEHTYSSYVRIRDVTLKTCQKRWMIGRSGERGSGISVLAARHDDHDDDEVIQCQIYFYANNHYYFKQFSLAWVHSLIVKNISISSNSI